MTTSLIDLVTSEMWDDVMVHMEKSAGEARLLGEFSLFATRTKGYPLHALCKMSDFPISILAALTMTMPAAVRIPVHPSRMLPIHIVCMGNASLLAIQHLVSLDPYSVLRPDLEGNLPIHHACSFADESIVKFLISVSPQSVRFTNLKNQMPLHMACNRYSVPLGVVEMLLQYYPGAAMHQDWQLQVPLHKAVTWKASVAVIVALLNAFPDGTRVRDVRSLTPYKLGRKLAGLTSEDSIIKLLRLYRREHDGLVMRTCDVVQFGVETVQDKILPSRRSRIASAV